MNRKRAQRSFANLTVQAATLILTAVAGVNAAHAEESRLAQMISPGFHPVTFEDPRSISEARLIYAYHRIDEGFVTGGGDTQIYALQLRYALNDRLALIATKDGIVDLNTKANVPSATGLADLEAGVKYAFYKDDEAGTIATAALRYLIPVGDEDVFQGQGDGEVHPSLSGAVALSQTVNLTSGVGLRAPLDSADSLFWDFDVQLDKRVELSHLTLYPLIGLSLVHIGRAGDRLPIPDEGQDFFNFGSAGSKGETQVIGALGTRVRVTDAVDLGTTAQIPLTRDEGTQILDYRFTFDAIWRY